MDSWREQTKPCAHQEPGERSSEPTRDEFRICRCSLRPNNREGIQSCPSTKYWIKNLLSMAQQWKQWWTLFLGAHKSLQMVTAAMKLKDACFLEEKLWLNEQCMKKQRHYFAHKGPYSQSYGFPSSHVRMWELDNKRGWASKYRSFSVSPSNE